jgi:tripartite ATP-independent transporter DctM subunit
VTAALCLTLLLGMAVGVPIASSLGLAALAGLLVHGSLPLTLLPQRIFVGLDSFPLLAAPLFILAGALMETGGISLRITGLAQAVVGHIRGGLGMVVVLGTMLFSGISGSSTADTAAIGSVMIPTMVRRGYSREFATAVVAAAGGMGILIPPCIIMVIYGLLTNTSVAALFLGGVVPGLVMGGTVLAATYGMARRLGLPVEARFSGMELGRALRRSVWALLMPAIIMGGILFGVFTVTEAAVVAVVYGWVVAVFVYRELRWRDLPRILVDSGVTTGLVMLVVGMAAAFAWLLTAQQVPLAVAGALAAVSSNPWFFLLLVNLAYLVIGCVFEVTAALIMTVPILLPVATLYGIDPVHLGVVVTANMGIGLVTPPVGVCLYVACGISGARIERVARPLAPFLAVMCATLLLITYVPEITLALPRLLLGYGR